MGLGERGGGGRARGNFGRTAGGAVGSERTRQTDGQIEGGGLEDCRLSAFLPFPLHKRPTADESVGRLVFKFRHTVRKDTE